MSAFFRLFYSNSCSFLLKGEVSSPIILLCEVHPNRKEKFTRITINVPQIVINCFWDIASWCRVTPAAMSCPPFNPPPFGHPLKKGKGGHLWLLPICIIHRNMKTRHYISGCGGVVLSGLCSCRRFASLRGTKQSREQALYMDCFVPRSDVESSSCINPRNINANDGVPYGKSAIRRSQWH